MKAIPIFIILSIIFIFCLCMFFVYFLKIISFFALVLNLETKRDIFTEFFPNAKKKLILTQLIKQI